MKINNLKDLSTKLSKVHEGTWKPGNLPVLEFSEENMVVKTITGMYRRTIRDYRRKIDNTFLHSYGKSVNCPECMISEMVFKLKGILERTGASSLDQITYAIRRYLGYRCSFFKMQDNKVVPVDGDRLERAYQAIKENKSFIEIENILYL